MTLSFVPWCLCLNVIHYFHISQQILRVLQRPTTKPPPCLYDWTQLNATDNANFDKPLPYFLLYSIYY